MDLTLAEQLTLLSLDDRTGQTVCAHTGYAVSAAIVAELELLGRVTIDGDTVRVVNASTLGDSVLNEAIENIDRSSGQLSLLVRSPLAEQQCERVVERLVTLGILKRVEKKALGIFRYCRYPEHDGTAEQEIKNRLRAAALGFVGPEPRLRALLAIAYATGLVDALLSKTEKRDAAARVKELSKSNAVAQALLLAIRDDEQAAATAAVTVGMA